MNSVEDDDQHMEDGGQHMEDEGHHEEEVVTEEDESQNDEAVVEESLLSNKVSVEPSSTPIYPIYVVPEDDKSKTTQVVIYHDDSIR